MKSVRSRGLSRWRIGISYFVLICFVQLSVAEYAGPAYADASAGEPAYANASADKLAEQSLHASPFTFHDISIPSDLGSIDESYQGTSGKKIIFIQDAHDSLEAQENIAKMIDKLVADDGIRTVYEEGFEGEVPTDKYFGIIPDSGMKQKISYFFLDKLRISGAEYAHINRKQEFKLMGADNIKMHLENIEWYKKSSETMDETETELKAIHHEIEQIANLRYPAELKDYMRLKKRFEKNEINLLDYLKRIRDLHPALPEDFNSQYPVISAIFNPDAESFNAASIDAKVLFSEMENLEFETAKHYLDNPRDETLFRHDHDLSLLRRLNKIEVTSVEYQNARKLVSAVKTEDLAKFILDETGRSIVLSKKWERNIRTSARFYEIAKKRDKAVSKAISQFLKTENETTAVLVFGGFHKENIKSILKGRGISFVVVTPKISEQSRRHEQYYKQLMSKGFHSFELPANVKMASRPENLFENPDKAALLIFAAYHGAAEIQAADTPSFLNELAKEIPNILGGGSDLMSRQTKEPADQNAENESKKVETARSESRDRNARRYAERIDRLLNGFISDPEKRAEEIRKAFSKSGVRERYQVGRRGVAEAAFLLDKYGIIKKGHPTPLLSIPELNEAVSSILGRKVTVLLKDETGGENNPNRTGSFKDRAPIKLYHYHNTEKPIDKVIAVSTGNHGNAAANAGQITGVDVEVFVGADAQEHKREKMRQRGALVTDVNPKTGQPIQSYREAEDIVFEIIGAQDSENPKVIQIRHADPFVVSGYGTAGAEISEQLKSYEKVMRNHPGGEGIALLAPLGSGGYYAGLMEILRELPEIRTFGVSSPGADQTFRSMKEGRLIRDESSAEIVDGIAATPEPFALDLIAATSDGAINIPEEDAFYATALIEKFGEKYGLKPEATSGLPLAAAILNPDLFFTADTFILPITSRNRSEEMQEAIETLLGMGEGVERHFKERLKNVRRLSREDLNLGIGQGEVERRDVQLQITRDVENGRYELVHTLQPWHFRHGAIQEPIKIMALKNGKYIFHQDDENYQFVFFNKTARTIYLSADAFMLLKKTQRVWATFLELAAKVIEERKHPAGFSRAGQKGKLIVQTLRELTREAPLPQTVLRRIIFQMFYFVFNLPALILDKVIFPSINLLIKIFKGLLPVFGLDGDLLLTRLSVWNGVNQWLLNQVLGTGWADRVEMLRSIAKNPDNEGRESLRQAINDNFWVVRIEAVKIIRDLKYTEALKYLRDRKKRMKKDDLPEEMNTLNSAIETLEEVIKSQTLSRSEMRDNVNRGIYAGDISPEEIETAIRRFEAAGKLTELYEIPVERDAIGELKQPIKLMQVEDEDFLIFKDAGNYQIVYFDREHSRVVIPELFLKQLPFLKDTLDGGIIYPDSAAEVFMHVAIESMREGAEDVPVENIIYAYDLTGDLKYAFDTHLEAARKEKDLSPFDKQVVAVLNGLTHFQNWIFERFIATPAQAAWDYLRPLMLRFLEKIGIDYDPVYNEWLRKREHFQTVFKEMAGEQISDRMETVRNLENKDDFSEEILFLALADESWAVRAEAAKKAGELGSEKALPILKRIISMRTHEEERYVVDAAREAIPLIEDAIRKREAEIGLLLAEKARLETVVQKLHRQIAELKERKRSAEDRRDPKARSEMREQVKAALFEGEGDYRQFMDVIRTLIPRPLLEEYAAKGYQVPVELGEYPSSSAGESENKIFFEFEGRAKMLSLVLKASGELFSLARIGLKDLGEQLYLTNGYINSFEAARGFNNAQPEGKTVMLRDQVFAWWFKNNIINFAEKMNYKKITMTQTNILPQTLWTLGFRAPGNPDMTYAEARRVPTGVTWVYELDKSSDPESKSIPSEGAGLDPDGLRSEMRSEKVLDVAAQDDSLAAKRQLKDELFVGADNLSRFQELLNLLIPKPLLRDFHRQGFKVPDELGDFPGKGTGTDEKRLKFGALRDRPTKMLGLHLADGDENKLVTTINLFDSVDALHIGVGIMPRFAERETVPPEIELNKTFAWWFENNLKPFAQALGYSAITMANNGISLNTLKLLGFKPAGENQIIWIYQFTDGSTVPSAVRSGTRSDAEIKNRAAELFEKLSSRDELYKKLTGAIIRDGQLVRDGAKTWIFHNERTAAEISEIGSIRYFDQYGKWILGVEPNGNLTDELFWTDNPKTGERRLTEVLTLSGNGLWVRLKAEENGMIRFSRLAETDESTYEFFPGIDSENPGNIPFAWPASDISIPFGSTGTAHAVLRVQAYLAKDQGVKMVYIGDKDHQILSGDKYHPSDRLFSSILEVADFPEEFPAVNLNAAEPRMNFDQPLFMLDSERRAFRSYPEEIEWEPNPPETIINKESAIYLSTRNKIPQRVYYDGHYMFFLDYKFLIGSLTDPAATHLIEKADEGFLLTTNKNPVVLIDEKGNILKTFEKEDRQSQRSETRDPASGNWVMPDDEVMETRIALFRNQEISDENIRKLRALLPDPLLAALSKAGFEIDERLGYEPQTKNPQNGKKIIVNAAGNASGFLALELKDAEQGGTYAKIQLRDKRNILHIEQGYIEGFKEAFEYRPDLDHGRIFTWWFEHQVKDFARDLGYQYVEMTAINGETRAFLEKLGWRPVNPLDRNKNSIWYFDLEKPTQTPRSEMRVAKAARLLAGKTPFSRDFWAAVISSQGIPQKSAARFAEVMPRHRRMLELLKNPHVLGEEPFRRLLSNYGSLILPLLDQLPAGYETRLPADASEIPEPISRLFSDVFRLDPYNSIYAVRHFSLLIHYLTMGKSMRQSLSDYFDADSQVIDLNRLLADHGLQFRVRALTPAFLNSAEGFIKLHSLSPENAVLVYHDKMKKETIEKRLPGFEVKKIQADASDPIAVTFADIALLTQRRDKSYPEKIVLPYDPYKYSLHSRSPPAERERLRAAMRLGGKKMVVVSATDKLDETSWVLDAYREINREDFKEGIVLVLISSGNQFDVEGLTRSGFSAKARVSVNEPLPDLSGDVEVLVLNTSGEVPMFLDAADAYFLGDRNGMEGLGVPMIYSASGINNNRTIKNVLMSAGAAVESTPEQLAAKLTAVLKNPEVFQEGAADVERIFNQEILSRHRLLNSLYVGSAVLESFAKPSQTRSESRERESRDVRMAVNADLQLDDKDLRVRFYELIRQHMTKWQAFSGLLETYTERYGLIFDFPEEAVQKLMALVDFGKSGEEWTLDQRYALSYITLNIDADTEMLEKIRFNLLMFIAMKRMGFGHGIFFLGNTYNTQRITEKLSSQVSLMHELFSYRTGEQEKIRYLRLDIMTALEFLQLNLEKNAHRALVDEAMAIIEDVLNSERVPYEAAMTARYREQSDPLIVLLPEYAALFEEDFYKDPIGAIRASESFRLEDGVTPSVFDAGRIGLIFPKNVDAAILPGESVDKVKQMRLKNGESIYVKRIDFLRTSYPEEEIEISKKLEAFLQIKDKRFHAQKFIGILYDSGLYYLLSKGVEGKRLTESKYRNDPTVRKITDALREFGFQDAGEDVRLKDIIHTPDDQYYVLDLESISFPTLSDWKNRSETRKQNRENIFSGNIGAERYQHLINLLVPRPVLRELHGKGYRIPDVLGEFEGKGRGADTKELNYELNVIPEDRLLEIKLTDAADGNELVDIRLVDSGKFLFLGQGDISVRFPEREEIVLPGNQGKTFGWWLKNSLTPFAKELGYEGYSVVDSRMGEVRLRALGLQKAEDGSNTWFYRFSSRSEARADNFPDFETVELTDDDIRAYFGEEILAQAKKDGRQFIIKKLHPTEDIHFLHDWKRDADQDKDFINRWKEKHPAGKSRDFPFFGQMEYFGDTPIGLVSRANGEERLEAFMDLGFYFKGYTSENEWTFQADIMKLETYYRYFMTPDHPMKPASEVLLKYLIKTGIESGKITHGISLYQFSPGGKAFADEWGFEADGSNRFLAFQDMVNLYNDSEDILADRLNNRLARSENRRTDGEDIPGLKYAPDPLRMSKVNLMISQGILPEAPHETFRQFAELVFDPAETLWKSKRPLVVKSPNGGDIEFNLAVDEAGRASIHVFSSSQKIGYVDILFEGNTARSWVAHDGKNEGIWIDDAYRGQGIGKILHILMIYASFLEGHKSLVIEEAVADVWGILGSLGFQTVRIYHHGAVADFEYDFEKQELPKLPELKSVRLPDSESDKSERRSENRAERGLSTAQFAHLLKLKDWYSGGLLSAGQLEFTITSVLARYFREHEDPSAVMRDLELAFGRSLLTELGFLPTEDGLLEYGEEMQQVFQGKKVQKNARSALLGFPRETRLEIHFSGEGRNIRGALGERYVQIYGEKGEDDAYILFPDKDDVMFIPSETLSFLPFEEVAGEARRIFSELDPNYLAQFDDGYLITPPDILDFNGTYYGLALVQRTETVIKQGSEKLQTRHIMLVVSMDSDDKPIYEIPVIFDRGRHLQGIIHVDYDDLKRILPAGDESQDTLQKDGGQASDKSQEKRSESRSFDMAQDKVEEKERVTVIEADANEVLDHPKMPAMVYVAYEDLVNQFSPAQRAELFAEAFNRPEVRLVIYNADLADERLKPFKELEARKRNVRIIADQAEEAFELTQKNFVKGWTKFRNLHLSGPDKNSMETFTAENRRKISFFRYSTNETKGGLLTAALLWKEYKEADQWLEGIAYDDDGFLTVVEGYLTDLVQNRLADLVIMMAA